MYTSPIPATYNSSTINVDPESLQDAATNVYNLVNDIATCLGSINTTLSNLTLSWAGQSASDAQTYNNEWNTAVQNLFGTQNDPDIGALSILTNGLNQAAANYSGVEDAIVNMYNSFASGFSSGSSNNNNNGQAPTSVTSPNSDSPTTEIQLPGGGSEYLYHTTAVNESF